MESGVKIPPEVHGRPRPCPHAAACKPEASMQCGSMVVWGWSVGGCSRATDRPRQCTAERIDRSIPCADASLKLFCR